jgi:hypothetical protein
MEVSGALSALPRKTPIAVVCIQAVTPRPQAGHELLALEAKSRKPSVTIGHTRRPSCVRADPWHRGIIAGQMANLAQNLPGISEHHHRESAFASPRGRQQRCGRAGRTGRAGSSRPGLLAFPRTLRRTLDCTAGLSGLILGILLNAMNICVATRSFLLMRRVGMILGLEMFGLMLATFANPGHHFSNVENHP